MDKTIKQLADDYGMSKPAMQYHIKKLPKSYKNFDSKNGGKILMVTPEGQDLLASWLSNKQTKEVANFATKEEISELKHKLDMKELESQSRLEKIELLEKRAEEDKERIASTLKLLDQAQQLQAMAEQKIKLLEQKEESKAPEPDKSQKDKQLIQNLVTACKKKDKHITVLFILAVIFGITAVISVYLLLCIIF